MLWPSFVINSLNAEIACAVVYFNTELRQDIDYNSHLPSCGIILVESLFPDA
jgi:hypothetical protein